MAGSKPISVTAAFDKVTFLPNREPGMPDDESSDAFAKLTDYRDGAVFIGHYAGNSEWERHGAGEEIVWALEGETTLIFWTGADEMPNRLAAGDMIVVPQGVWHRFQTPGGVKILSVTPQPTDHRLAHPGNG